MKKLIPKIFLCTALASVMCISTAFAAGPISVSKDGSDVTVTVNGLTGNEETTLFVVQHGTTVEKAFEDTSKVYYLDQTPADSSGTATFGFTYEGTDTLDIFSGYETMTDKQPLEAIVSDESDSGDEPTGEFMYGDVNNDGKINILDATTVVSYVLSNIPFVDSNTREAYEYGVQAADVTGDSKVNILDVTTIVSYVLSNVEFPVNVKQ